MPHKAHIPNDSGAACEISRISNSTPLQEKRIDMRNRLHEFHTIPASENTSRAEPSGVGDPGGRVGTVGGRDCMSGLVKHPIAMLAIGDLFRPRIQGRQFRRGNSCLRDSPRAPTDASGSVRQRSSIRRRCKAASFAILLRHNASSNTHNPFQ